MADASLLAQIPLFSSLNQSQMREVASKMTMRYFEAGQVIFKRGDPGTTSSGAGPIGLYIIISGQVKISAPGKGGGEVVLGVLGENDFFGEIALLDGGSRSATATAEKPTRALNMQRKELMSLLEDYPDVARQIIDIIKARISGMGGGA